MTISPCNHTGALTYDGPFGGKRGIGRAVRHFVKQQNAAIAAYTLAAMILFQNSTAVASPLDFPWEAQKTITLPYANAERMVWSDDASEIAVLLPRGVYVANTAKGTGLLNIWDKGTGDQGRLTQFDGMLSFTSDGQNIIGLFYTGGKSTSIWNATDKAEIDYLFTVLNIKTGNSRYVFTRHDHNSPMARSRVLTRDGSTTIAQIGTTGYFEQYDSTDFDSVGHDLGPIFNINNNGFGATQMFYDAVRSRLILGYINGDVKTWDTTINGPENYFATSKTGFSAAALDCSTGDLYVGGNGLITGGGRDDPNTMVRSWDVTTGTLIRAYSGTASKIDSLTVSPSGRYIAAVEGGQRLPLRLLVWRKDEVMPIGLIDYGAQSERSAVAFSPDGKTLAVAVKDRIEFFSVPQ